MDDLKALTDAQLEDRLQKAILRHDRLIDSADMGDERIYFADKECRALTDEQDRRKSLPDAAA